MSVRTLIEDAGYAISNTISGLGDGWSDADAGVRRLAVAGVLAVALLIGAAWLLRGLFTGPEHALTDTEMQLLEKTRKRMTTTGEDARLNQRFPWAPEWPDDD